VPKYYLKLILSDSTTNGSFRILVLIDPMYSPRIPIKNTWIDPKKKIPIKIGAIPIENVSQYKIFAVRK